MATLPSWVTKAPSLYCESPTDIGWENGHVVSVVRKYTFEVTIPSDVVTPADRATWLVANIECARFSDSVNPFVGIPSPGSSHPTHTYLIAKVYRITLPGYNTKIVQVQIEYALPDTQQSSTNNGTVPVPFGSWGVTVGWTTAKLAGTDYRGKPFMTVAGEVVNVQANVPIYTYAKSDKTTSSSIAAPTINSAATSLTGVTIPKHCGLRSQTNVENTGSDWQTYPRILTTQVIYIPRYVSVTGTLVNPGGEITTLADVGSFDVLTLHQGYREKVNGRIQTVTYHDKIGGKRPTFTGLSVLDASGVHVEPDPSTGAVTPYYLAFQVYPSATW